MGLRAWWRRVDQAMAARRRRRQRQDVHARLLRAWARLDELRSYVDRDRRHERAERDRLIAQRLRARERLADMEDLIRASLQGQALLQAELTARLAREALDSDFHLESR